MSNKNKLNIKDIVWNLCFKPGITYSDSTKEIHYDILDMLIEKYNIEDISFESCLKLYSLLGEIEICLGQIGGYYNPPKKIVIKLKNKYDKLLNRNDRD